MRRSVYKLSMFIGVFLLSSVVMAQEQTCPALVQAALSATAEQCGATGRNQICYGNVSLEAVPRSGVEDFTFSTPGDIVPVNAINSIRLNSQIEEQGTWGVALMKLQANIPDSLPGQNVTFLRFGDVQLRNAAGNDTADTALTPMQAFYFQSGIHDAPCAQAPDSGILIQTPEGVETVQFTVNDVHFTLGSTLYLQAQAPGNMTASVIEGEATIEAYHVSMVVPAGSQVTIPLDELESAFGVPSEPQPYDETQMEALPTGILERAITVADPASTETLAALEPVPAEGAIHLAIGNQADWVDTGIALDAGQTFTVAARGRMNPCLDTYPNGAAYCIFFAPQGSGWVVTANNEYGVFPGLGLRFMALIGRVGDGDPFYIGMGGTFTAEQAGHLWLTPNDNTRIDNRGVYRVWVWRAGG
ncbi:MAG: hypothetical protein K8I60_07070 [Anaerolineae bacterium]|nr:hypothetical protein [Anaerolineae bacterium]